MTTMMYPTLMKSQSMRSKRKSAVELLAESKPFYVKSEIVRDTTQAQPARPPPSFATGYGSYTRSKSVNVTSNVLQNSNNCRPACLPYMAVSPSRSLPPLSHRRTVHTANSDMLQNKLRQLLDCDSAEELSVEHMAPLSPPAEYAQRCHKSLPDLHCRGEPSSNKSSNKSLSNRDSGGSSGHYTQRSEPAPPPRQETRRDSGSSTQHSGGSSYYCCQDQDCRLARQTAYPPTTSTFKRQKCLRYKKDRPILRSKSDISDRYWRPPDPPVSHLEQFFEHLGLTSDSYEEMLNDSGASSPVFFSDVSTVDSSRPIDNNDCCPATYRPSEPPSIVERNARIIKWLCNCRKAMMS
ncbi:uncharacterized protein LOC108735479 [Agrilus planipennis]|uniref:Uncharacterized protein LOC108735479 n=1 Tax=Agrilus planipennis TaxID=224129 RepID=A0A1W4WSF0_AGRPL|nr:uncharacterized protein LOC108735479 [Agrilus planipennis]XP_018322955.1 uncharacterized protein LOC108735479 [Agrilus planipennis]